MKMVSWELSGTIPKNPLFVYKTKGLDFPDAARTAIFFGPDEIP